ncbi:MAG: hypothetical protein ACLQJ7_13180 [Syntrophobacteraceae bacterium]
MRNQFQLPDSFDICNLVCSIVPHSDFALPNDNEKRHPEAAIQTATRSGKKTVAGSKKRGARSEKREAGSGGKG